MNKQAKVMIVLIIQAIKMMLYLMKNDRQSYDTLLYSIPANQKLVLHFVRIDCRLYDYQ